MTGEFLVPVSRSFLFVTLAPQREWERWERGTHVIGFQTSFKSGLEVDAARQTSLLIMEGTISFFCSLDPHEKNREE